MNIKYFLLIVVVSLFFHACNSKYSDHPTILAAETALNTNADSALNILNTIKHPDSLNRNDYAAWCLHYTHACYKLKKDISSDSLILIAVKHYHSQNLALYEGTARYLWGCILRKQNKPDEALSVLKDADRVLTKTNNNILKGLVDFNIGLLYYNNEFFEASNFYYKKSLKYFKITNNKKYLAYSYRAIFENYYEQGIKLDSIIYLIDLSIKYAKASGDTANYYYNIGRKGELIYKKDYEKSKNYLLEAYNFFEPKPFYICAFLAYNYSHLNQPDSAKYYLKLALNQNYDLKFKRIAYNTAAKIHKNEGKYKEAYEYLEKYNQIIDSVYKQNIADQLYKTDKKYDLTVKEKENAELKVSNRNRTILIGTLVIFLLLAIIAILMGINIDRKRKAKQLIEKQNIEHELETRKMANASKRELLHTNLKNKLENTLRLNRLKLGAKSPEKIEAFLAEISSQVTLSESEWEFYVTEVDKIFDNKISSLSIQHPLLTLADLIVISLIAMGIDITDSCIILNMSKNTMYHRRRIIKERLELDNQQDVESFVKFLTTIE